MNIEINNNSEFPELMNDDILPLWEAQWIPRRIIFLKVYNKINGSETVELIKESEVKDVSYKGLTIKMTFQLK